MEFKIHDTWKDAYSNIARTTFTVKTRKDFRNLITFMDKNDFASFSDNDHVFATYEFKSYPWDSKKTVLYRDSNNELHCIVENREREGRDVKKVTDIWFKR